jgi:hypothetical protein
MKRVFIFILMAFYICLATKTNAQETSGTCGPNLVWLLMGEGANQTLIITGTGTMYDYYGTAPWYSQRQNIKYLTVDNSVTTIGNYAFYGCANFTTLNIGSNVTKIHS